MAKTPEFLQPETQPDKPNLIGFLGLKPDESLRVVKAKQSKSNISPQLEFIKLETPLGTDDVAMSGYMKVTQEEITDFINYFNNAPEAEKSKFDAIIPDILAAQSAFET